MIGEEAFKGLCARSEEGVPIRALFITPNAPQRNQQQLDMLNMADGRGLMPVYVRVTHTLMIGHSAVLLRIAHPYLDREMKGQEFHFIHGLEYLDAFEDGERIKDELAVRVRL